MTEVKAPGKVEVRLSINAKFTIDEDELGPVRAQGWEDTLRYLQLNGIPITKRVEIVK
jgi:hypothetical protein